MTTNVSEIEDNERLHKAADYLKYCREQANQARQALKRAEEQVTFARVRYESIFAECEKRAVARRRSGLVTVEAGY